jgi:hypothetical protein
MFPLRYIVQMRGSPKQSPKRLFAIRPMRMTDAGGHRAHETLHRRGVAEWKLNVISGAIQWLSPARFRRLLTRSFMLKDFRSVFTLVLGAGLALPFAASAQQAQPPSSTTTSTTPDGTQTTTTTTSPMTKGELKAQRKQQKEQEKSAKDNAKASKDNAKAVKSQDKATDAQEKAQQPQ